MASNHRESHLGDSSSLSSPTSSAGLRNGNGQLSQSTSTTSNLDSYDPNSNTSPLSWADRARLAATRLATEARTNETPRKRVTNAEGAENSGSNMETPSPSPFPNLPAHSSPLHTESNGVVSSDQRPSGALAASDRVSPLGSRTSSYANTLATGPTSKSNGSSLASGSKQTISSLTSSVLAMPSAKASSSVRNASVDEDEIRTAVSQDSSIDESSQRHLLPAAKPAVNVWSQRQAQRSAQIAAVAGATPVTLSSSQLGESSGTIDDLTSSTRSLSLDIGQKAKGRSMAHSGQSADGNGQIAETLNNLQKFPLLNERDQEVSPASHSRAHTAAEGQVLVSRDDMEISPKGKTKWTKITPTITHSTDPPLDRRRHAEGRNPPESNRYREDGRGKRKDKFKDGTNSSGVHQKSQIAHTQVSADAMNLMSDNQPFPDDRNMARPSRASSQSSHKSRPRSNSTIPTSHQSLHTQAEGASRSAVTSLEPQHFTYLPGGHGNEASVQALDSIVPQATSNVAMSRQSSRHSEGREGRSLEKHRKNSYRPSAFAENSADRKHGPEHDTFSNWLGTAEHSAEWHRDAQSHSRGGRARPSERGGRGTSHHRGSGNRNYRKRNDEFYEIPAFPMFPFDPTHLQPMLGPGGQPVALPPFPPFWPSMSDPKEDRFDGSRASFASQRSIDSPCTSGNTLFGSSAFFIPPISQQEMAARSQVGRAVREQVEFYFSGANLVRDMFLRKAMNNEGFVPLPFIADFRRVQNLTTNLEFILDVLSTSEELSIFQSNPHSAISAMIRPKEGWQQWIVAPEERLDLEKMEMAQRQLSETARADSIGHRTHESLGHLISPPSRIERDRINSSFIVPVDKEVSSVPRRASTGVVPAIRMPPRRNHVVSKASLAEEVRNLRQYEQDILRNGMAPTTSQSTMGIQGAQPRPSTSILRSFAEQAEARDGQRPIRDLSKAPVPGGSDLQAPRDYARNWSDQSGRPNFTKTEPSEQSELTRSPKKANGRLHDSALLDEDDEDPFGDNYMEEQMAGVESFVKGWGSRSTSVEPQQMPTSETSQG